MTVSSVMAQPLPVSWMDCAAGRCQWSLRCLEPCESCKGWYLNPLQRQTKRTGFSEDPMLTARLREPWRYRSPGGSRKDVQRLPKGYPRDTQGIPKGYPRATQGIPKGYPRDTQGIPKGYSREQQARITGAIPEQPRINAVAVRSIGASPCTLQQGLGVLAGGVGLAAQHAGQFGDVSLPQQAI